MQKCMNFTHFNQINTHINECKIVYIYKNATVIVHICTITLALHLIFYYFFSLLHLTLSFSLWCFHSHHSLSLSLVPHSHLTDLRSKPPLISEASHATDFRSKLTLVVPPKIAAEVSSLANQFWDFLFNQWVLGF